MTKEELDKEIAKEEKHLAVVSKELEKMRKELWERGEEFDRAYNELADCTIEAEYKERFRKMEKAWSAYDSAYANYIIGVRQVFEYRTALKMLKKVATAND